MTPRHTEEKVGGNRAPKREDLPAKDEEQQDDDTTNVGSPEHYRPL